MRKAEKRPSWFKMFLHQKSIVESAPDEVVGRAIKAAFHYFATREELPLDVLPMVVYSSFKPYIEESFADYERDVRNGQRGGRPQKPPVTPCKGGLPTQTQAEADAEAKNNIMCSKAVELLNALSGSSFRASTNSTQRLIHARENEGYTWEDIEAVIRHQCGLWGKDAKMRKYLRPKTLFGNKFESYLSDAKRCGQAQAAGYVLASFEDPWDAAEGVKNA